MSLQPSAKIVIITSKGPLDVELYAKEVPVAQDLVNKAKKTELNGAILGYNADAAIIHFNCKLLNFTRKSHSRLKFSRFSVCVDGESVVIVLKESAVELAQTFVVVGKVTGESVYNLEKVKNQEFETVIRSVRVGDEEEAAVDTVVAEKTKKKKRKVKIDYGEEDEGIKMVSAYEGRGGMANAGRERRKEIEKVAEGEKGEKIQTEEIKGETEVIEGEREVIERVPETKPETKPEGVPETMPETVPETVPETKPEGVPETMPETVPETEPETKPETEPETELKKVESTEITKEIEKETETKEETEEIEETKETKETETETETEIGKETEKGYSDIPVAALRRHRYVRK